ncbi:MAG: NfeD family protein [Luteolibacter sp.]
MTAILLLFLIGVIFIAVEVIIPGGILGAIGGLLMFAGCVVAFGTYGTWGGVIALAAALLLGALGLFLEFWVLPKTALGKRAFLTAEVTGVSAALGKEALDLVGQPAEALTMLSPTGYVRVDGKRYEAFCQSGQVPAGTLLDIVSADSFRLIVSPRKTN